MKFNKTSLVGIGFLLHALSLALSGTPDFNAVITEVLAGIGIITGRQAISKVQK